MVRKIETFDIWLGRSWKAESMSGRTFVRRDPPKSYVILDEKRISRRKRLWPFLTIPLTLLILFLTDVFFFLFFFFFTYTLYLTYPWSQFRSTNQSASLKILLRFGSFPKLRYTDSTFLSRSYKSCVRLFSNFRNYWLQDFCKHLMCVTGNDAQ